MYQTIGTKVQRSVNELESKNGLMNPSPFLATPAFFLPFLFPLLNYTLFGNICLKQQLID